MLIYLVTNKVNGKVYVGKTTKSLSERWRRHLACAKVSSTGMALHSAIRKHGPDVFSVQELQGAHSVEELNRLEAYFVELFAANVHGIGYNLSSGGDGGGIPTHAVRSKISRAVSAAMTEEVRERISSSVFSSMSPEVRKRMSDSASISSHNRLKTHCKRGHLFNAVNTYNPPGGGRVCRECDRLKKKSRKEIYLGKAPAKD